MRVFLPRSPQYHGQVHNLLAELRRYDPKLRLRWSHERKKWALEAKAASRQDGLFLPVKYVTTGRNRQEAVREAEYSDRSVGWRDGYYQICFAPYLDRRIMRYLYGTDTHRAASAKQFVKGKEGEEAAREAAADAKNDERLAEYADEAAGYAWAKCGGKVYMGANSVRPDSQSWW